MKYVFVLDDRALKENNQFTWKEIQEDINNVVRRHRLLLTSLYDRNAQPHSNSMNGCITLGACLNILDGCGAKHRGLRYGKLGKQWRHTLQHAQHIAMLGRECVKQYRHHPIFNSLYEVCSHVHQKTKYLLIVRRHMI